MRIKKFLFLAVALFVGIAAVSCSDDKDEPIVFDQLPESARTFIKSYFPTSSASRVEKEGKGSSTTYDVYFTDGTKVEFDHKGEWKDVDAPYGQSVPADLVPAPIKAFVADAYPGEYINEISRDSQGYDVELGNGVDLVFDLDGIFVKVDK